MVAIEMVDDDDDINDINEDEPQVEEVVDEEAERKKELAAMKEAAEADTWAPAPDTGRDTAGKPKGKGPDPHALLADGKKQKEIGFGAYKVGNYEKAITCWCMARGSMKHILDKEFFKGNDEKVKETADLEHTMHLNLAQAYLKNKEFYQALNFCKKVLDKEPDNLKAWYRKASAHMMGSQYPEARSAIDEMLKLESDNASAKQLLLEIARKEEASKKTGKKAAKKMLNAFDGEHDPRIKEVEPMTWNEWKDDKADSFFDALFDCRWCSRRKQN